MKFWGCVFAIILPFVAMADIASTQYVGDASNITSGTVNVGRLPVGDSSGTVASGDDVRFETISVGKPNVAGTETRAVIWVE